MAIDDGSVQEGLCPTAPYDCLTFLVEVQPIGRELAGQIGVREKVDIRGGGGDGLVLGRRSVSRCGFQRPCRARMAWNAEPRAEARGL